MAVTKILSSIAVLAIFSSNAQAQFISSGNCRADVEVAANFNVTKYMGVWYEYAKYPVHFEHGDCIKATYTLQNDGNVYVRNSQVNETSGLYHEINGSASVVSNGKLLVTFPISSPHMTNSNYWVLGTDYSFYSVVYYCKPLADDQHATSVWILTRHRVPSSITINNAESVLKNLNISLKPLTVTKQRGCADKRR